MNTVDEKAELAVVHALRLYDLETRDDPRDILVELARKFGIEPIGERREWVNYEPNELHHDEFGFGIQPGGICLIRFPGWMYTDGTVLVKAIVILTKNQMRNLAAVHRADASSAYVKEEKPPQS